MKNVLYVVTVLIMGFFQNTWSMHNAGHRMRIGLNGTNARNLEIATQALIAYARSQNQNIVRPQKVVIIREDRPVPRRINKKKLA